MPVTEWKEEYLIKIQKNGDLSKCENYIDITLLSAPLNDFNRVLLNQITDLVDAKLRDR